MKKLKRWALYKVHRLLSRSAFCYVLQLKGASSVEALTYYRSFLEDLSLEDRISPMLSALLGKAVIH